MSNRIDMDVQGQTVDGKGSPSSKWGKLLFSVETDRKRVGLEILIRLGVSAFAVLFMWYRGTSLGLAVLVIFVIFTAWPLLHMGDRMELYQNGIAYQGKLYPIGAEGRVTWVGGRGFFLPTTHLDISGCKDRINVSFMKDAQKLFNRAYNSAVYEKGA